MAQGAIPAVWALAGELSECCSEFVTEDKEKLKVYCSKPRQMAISEILNLRGKIASKSSASRTSPCFKKLFCPEMVLFGITLAAK